MAWTWQFEKADGSRTEPPLEPEEFTTQSDAESWVGEFWRVLRDGGVDQVVLFEDGTKVYGPMSLHPAEPEHEPAGAPPRREPGGTAATGADDPDPDPDPEPEPGVADDGPRGGVGVDGLEGFGGVTADPGAVSGPRIIDGA
ncbi:hypothetical protein FHU37_003948 [Allostreptomyces psammosilenae]|uniref:Uncharacterized protein n=1 Tax=Allostreptomyces psammosilenae TaxID=1892865 RepID=A0A852ZY71_9ACTN|nr:hypothetical protein [Allostreptomyces psammosilenae]